MREFTIRLATKKDLRAASKFGIPVVKSLEFYNKEHTARNAYEMSVKDLKVTLKRHRGSIIIAVAKDGNVVGLCTHFVGCGHVDWLDWILVDKSFRNKGLGRALMNYTIQEAKKHGCHKIWCDSNPGNKPALKFFRSMGFRKVGILRRHAFKEDEILWEKPIQ